MWEEKQKIRWGLSTWGCTQNTFLIEISQQHTSELNYNWAPSWFLVLISGGAITCKTTKRKKIDFYSCHIRFVSRRPFSFHKSIKSASLSANAFCKSLLFSNKTCDHHLFLLCVQVFVRSYRLLHILDLNFGYCYSSRRGSLLPYFVCHDKNTSRTSVWNKWAFRASYWY